MGSVSNPKNAPSLDQVLGQGNLGHQGCLATKVLLPTNKGCADLLWNLIYTHSLYLLCVKDQRPLMKSIRLTSPFNITSHLFGSLLLSTLLDQISKQRNDFPTGQEFHNQNTKLSDANLQKILVNINVGRWGIFSPQTWKEIILPEKNIEVCKENDSNWRDPDNGKTAIPVTKATLV